jgi:hypothetical protein
MFADLTAGELAELADTLARSLSDEHPTYGRPISLAWDTELAWLIGDVARARRAEQLRRRIRPMHADDLAELREARQEAT